MTATIAISLMLDVKVRINVAVARISPKTTPVTTKPNAVDNDVNAPIAPSLMLDSLKKCKRSGDDDITKTNNYDQTK